MSHAISLQQDVQHEIKKTQTNKKTPTFCTKLKLNQLQLYLQQRETVAVCTMGLL